MSKRALYEVYEYTCDLCGYIWKPDYWADNANGGSCNIVEDGLNGTDLVNFENLCRSCRKEIQDTVTAVLVKRGGQKWWERRKMADKSTGGGAADGR